MMSDDTQRPEDEFEDAQSPELDGDGGLTDLLNDVDDAQGLMPDAYADGGETDLDAEIASAQAQPFEDDGGVSDLQEDIGDAQDDEQFAVLEEDGGETDLLAEIDAVQAGLYEDDGGLSDLHEDIADAQDDELHPNTEFDLQAAMLATEAAPPVEPVADEAYDPVEDLTLAELLGQFWRMPMRTLNTLFEVAATPLNAPSTATATAGSRTLPRSNRSVSRGAKATDDESSSNQNAMLVGLSVVFVVSVIAGWLLTMLSWRDEAYIGVPFFPVLAISLSLMATVGMKTLIHGTQGNLTTQFRLSLPDWVKQFIQLMLWIGAFFVAARGALIMAPGGFSLGQTELATGGAYLLAAFFIWLHAEVFAAWGSGDGDTVADALKPTPPQDIPRWHWQLGALREMSVARVFAGLSLFVLCFVSYVEAGQNQWTTLGFYAWILSIIAALVLFAPRSWAPLRVFARLRGWFASLHWFDGDGLQIRLNWVQVIFILLLVVGVAFRLNDLSGVPGEMTSDHKEKLLDSQRVLEGDRDIFFRNNGGREGFQMYAMALFSQLPGQSMNHESLMLLAIVESLITLPVVFWLGKQIAGQENPRFGVWLGLALMGAMAVSYWHVAIARMALRIILTPLIGSLLLGFLVRGLRYHRRGDYIAAGLVLGFGLYAYQAVRMMPVLVLAAVGLGLMYALFRREWRLLPRLTGHLAVLVIVSFVIFIPLFRFSNDFPESFWMRSTGRLFGDDVIQEEDAEGNITLRDANIEDRLAALGDNLAQLPNNIRNAVLMFHWRGDQAWINGLPYKPELDPYAGALMILGLAACVGFAVRTRDPVYVLIPLAIFIMLLPSALSIAMVNENPSASRTSGAMPPTFILVAIPLALIFNGLRRLIPGKRGMLAGVAFGGLVLLSSLSYNWNTYFNDYRDVYERSTWPYSVPGEMLSDFAQSTRGNYGNAFQLFHPFWWDYTIVGIEGGAMDWPNGIGEDLEVALPNRIAELVYCPNVTYPLNPENDLLFFYHYDDPETEEQLLQWFPNGIINLQITRNSPVHDFKTMRVPALGLEAINVFIDEYATAPTCGPSF